MLVVVSFCNVETLWLRSTFNNVVTNRIVLEFFSGIYTPRIDFIAAPVAPRRRAVANGIARRVVLRDERWH